MHSSDVRRRVNGWATDLAAAGQYKRAIKVMVPMQHAPALWAETQARASLNSSPSAQLRNDSAIIALCERIELGLKQHANRIRKMLAEQDVDELLAPLKALA